LIDSIVDEAGLVENTGCKPINGRSVSIDIVMIRVDESGCELVCSLGAAL
jgi:hypothetical protein